MGGRPRTANGNQLSSTGLAHITWNAAGQPATVTALSGSPIAGTYDALGRLVETDAGGEAAQFFFSPTGAKVAVVRNGALTKATIPLPGGETAVYNANGLEFIRHTDWLGSSRLGTTWAHAVYSKESYAPFGETYNEAGTPDRSFTGQDQDTVTGAGATGVYDFLFRKYDPAAGRWISPDPLGWGAVNTADPQSLNRYAYVQNNPMSAIDPFGTDCVTVSSDNTLWQNPGDCLGRDPNNEYYVDCDGCSANAPYIFDINSSQVTITLADGSHQVIGGLDYTGTSNDTVAISTVADTSNGWGWDESNPQWPKTQPGTYTQPYGQCFSNGWSQTSLPVGVQVGVNAVSLVGLIYPNPVSTAVGAANVLYNFGRVVSVGLVCATPGVDIEP
jgi:RHS repeat-associated protein